MHSNGNTIGSYLQLDSLFPSPKILPRVNPTFFQRLDHTFTRKQWTNSVNKCKSKLYTSFPSNHHLRVTDMKIKLGPLRLPNRLDSMTGLTMFQRTFKAILKDLWKEHAHPDHNANITVDGPRVTVFADGSGIFGSCSRCTPAGWGWCYRNAEEWVDAYGPVSTDPNHLQSYGAQVGSNNTGELTAILETFLKGGTKSSSTTSRRLSQPPQPQCTCSGLRHM